MGCAILLVFCLLGSVEAIMVQEECCLLLWISLFLSCGITGYRMLTASKVSRVSALAVFSSFVYLFARCSRDSLLIFFGFGLGPQSACLLKAQLKQLKLCACVLLYTVIIN